MLKSFINLIKNQQEEIIKLNRALNEVEATIQSGDRVAIIGKNGSGKSTLLRVLTGIYQPTSGALEVQGSISSLLDLNVGLDTEATGYENIILLGILQGKTKREMKAKFKDIEDFTELKDYLKLPVRTYSLGMRLRLAFGIATCMESDILIIDEVIGVGDQLFMEKAQKRLKDLVHRCQILVLISHSTQILRQFCNKALVLNQGNCTFFGDLEQGISLYEESLHLQKEPHLTRSNA